MLGGELLDEVLKQSTQAIVLLNTEAVITYCTGAIEFITGYRSDEVIGKSAFLFFQPMDLPATRLHHEALHKEKQYSASSLVLIRHKNGSLVWVDLLVKNLLHKPAIDGLFAAIKRSSDQNSVEDAKLAKAIVAAKEEEREFIATELHDNINQLITSSKLLVDAAKESENHEEILNLCSKNLKQAAEEIRRLSYSLVSYNLQEFGLLSAVTSFIETITIVNTIHFNVDFAPEAENVLTTEQRLHVYRIIQEGVTNILKHAAATEVLISFFQCEGLVYLTIKDNGLGFSVTKQKAGVGMASIMNRIKFLKGHFHLTAPANQGTTIEIHFPL
jgi:PAS domain S-box-containing protein